MNAKDAAKQRLEVQIEMCKVAIEALDELPDGLPGWMRIATYSNDITIFIDVYSPEDFAKARRLLGRKVTPMRRRFFGSTGSRVHVYTHKELDCDVQLSLEPGKVCQRVQVGERVVPIYEVRCNESVLAKA